MFRSYCRLNLIRGLAQIALILIPSVGLGQRTDPPATVSPADDKGGLQLPLDRQVDLRLNAARTSIEQGDFGSAVNLLLQIASSDQESFGEAGGNSTFRPVRAVIDDLVARLPAETRKRFESEIDRAAQDGWNVAKATSPEGIAAFASLHYSTGPGLEALRLLAGLHRDAGRCQQAAAAWKSVEEHPRATQMQRTMALMARFECLLSLKDLPAAEGVARQLSGRGIPELVLIGGREVEPQQWATRQLQQAHIAPRVEANSGPSSKLPAPEPVWSRDVSTLAEIQKNVSRVRHYFHDQGVVSSASLRPQIVGNLVVTRTMQELQAYDRLSGDLQWAIPNQEYSWIWTNPSAVGNNLQRSPIASAWHRRSEADSIFSSLSTNGKLLIIVQEPDRPELDRQVLSGPPQQTPAGSQAHVRWNKLCGYETSNRQLRWQIGGPPTGPADVFGGAHFLGTPLFVDDLLFTIARRDDELLLMALDQETGHLRWSVKLGVLPPHLVDSAMRRRVACPITLSDGKLLCTTASGMLVSVNATTRSVEWAYRYPLRQHDLPARPANGSPTAVPPDVWWDEWRETTCVANDDRDQTPGSTANSAQRSQQPVVFVSPDTDHLHAVHRIDGTPLWMSPRAGGIYFAGIVDDCAIVVESMAVRAHDVRSGRLRWRTETGEIVGRGALAGKLFFQGRAAGGISVIDTTDGSQQFVPSSPEAVHGTLVPSSDGWIVQGAQSMQRLPWLETVRQRAQAQFDAERNETEAIELARLDLHGGDPAGALERLKSIESRDARILRREAILSVFSSQFGVTAIKAGAAPPLTPELAQELLGLSDTDEERLVALKALGDAELAGGNTVAALKHYFEGLDLVETLGVRSVGEWSASRISARTVRVDRMLLAAIGDVLRRTESGDSDLATMRQREEVEQLLQARLMAALGDDDPFAIQQILDQLLPLEWARRSLLNHSKVSLFARPLPKIELLLLSIAGSRDQVTAFRALECLADTLASSGWRRDAEAVQQRMLCEYPGLPLNNGRTLSAELATNSELSDLRTRLIGVPREPWPAVRPRVEKKEAASSSVVHYVPVRVRALPGSMLDRLDVAVHRSGRQVRFTGGGQIGDWEVTLPTPKVLRSAFANQDQVEAYGIGRLLIVRIGSEVFGILPFNERGEAIAAVTSLQLDIAPYEATWYPEPVAAKLGIRHEGARLVDGFGRALGGLGPVRPGYLCYQSQANLVAVDPLTGKRLWERPDLPANCHLFGDDDFVYLWRTDEGTLQVISAIDGRTVEERSWNLASSDVLMERGSLVWLVKRERGISLELRDARNGSIVWTKPLDAKSIPFAADQGTIGIVKPEGLLQLIEADTGSQIGEELTVEVPDKVERIVCLHDATRWYVAISGPVPRLANLQAQQLWGGLRVSFVNGWLYGIDRHSNAICWRRFLDSEPLPQSISHVAPVLVQMWRRYAVSPGKREAEEEGVLRIIDTRTGAEILTHQDPSLHPYSVLNPALVREELEVRTQRMTFHLNYVPLKEEGHSEQTR